MPAESRLGKTRTNENRWKGQQPVEKGPKVVVASCKILEQLHAINPLWRAFFNGLLGFSDHGSKMAEITHNAGLSQVALA